MHTGTTPHVSLSIEAWPAADLLMSMLAIVEKSAHSRLDAGSTWRDLAAPLPDDFLKRIDRYTKEIYINLLGLPFDHPEARTASGFLATLRSLPAEDVLRYLVGYYRRVFRRETPADVMDAAIAGDRDARREFRRTSFPEPVAWRDTLRHMLSAPAEDIRDEFADLVQLWLEAVYAAREADLLALTEADAAALRASSDGGRVETIVERAVPGVTFVPEVGQTHVVLVPSWALKPLWAVTDHRAANVFAYPAATRGGGAPPGRLVALGKAIGDETRLRILRELATEAATAEGLAERMGIPRTTLLHHLRILRSADLIAVQVHDSAYHTFIVRDERLGDVSRLLEQFLE
ncbi:MAG TPA: metalloregulator ArsR/SmtB family transcription factor [Candidatus Limnocylindrales bacterium]|nr:metalloregulator ArsR/SmtB family transcription factor [Candidatus Limnocylindrales bacterium]